MSAFNRDRIRTGFKDRNAGSGREGSPRRFSSRPSEGRSGSRTRSELQMHKATCAGCGAECDVPFRPTGSKPVYCRDCFRKNESRGGSRDYGNKPKSDFDQINFKLDKIMKALNIK